MNPDPTFIALLQNAVNRLLRLDSVALARVAELDGKLIRLQTMGPQSFAILVFPESTGLRFDTRAEREPDVTLSGDITVLLRFALRRFFPDISPKGDVQISGDVELGQRFQRILEQADIDWEEQTARFVGDVPAHQLGNWLRGLRDWSRAARQSLRQDLSEYLQEESRLLPARPRVMEFRESVDRLQRDVDELEQRVARLRRPSS